MQNTTTEIKINRGIRSNLPSEIKDGNIYICVDEGTIYTDSKTSTNGEVQRVQISREKNICKNNIIIHSTDWNSNNEFTIIDNNYFQLSGYQYIISPDDDSYDAYVEAGIRAKNISIAGKITFICKEKPTIDLKVNITRLGVKVQ